jgi:glycerol-3-phosphate O-acyltransferase
MSGPNGVAKEISKLIQRPYAHRVVRNSKHRKHVASLMRRRERLEARLAEGGLVGPETPQRRELSAITYAIEVLNLVSVDPVAGEPESVE